MENQDEKYLKNLEFLVIKSRDLLKEQFKSYESANTKSGLVISILSLIIPITLIFISKGNENNCLQILVFIPILCLVTATVFLLKVLLPKNLDNGFNFNQFDRYLEKGYNELLLYEIGANRSSYNENKAVVDKQHSFFKSGIIMIFCGTITLITILFINFVI